MNYRDLLVYASVIVGTSLFSSVVKAESWNRVPIPTYVSGSYGLFIESEYQSSMDELWQPLQEGKPYSNEDRVSLLESGIFFRTKSVDDFYSHYPTEMELAKSYAMQSSSIGNVEGLWFEYNSLPYDQDNVCNGLGQAFGLGSHMYIVEYVLAYLDRALEIYDFYDNEQQDFESSDFVAQICDDFAWQQPQNIREIDVYIDKVPQNWVYS
ncbi:hypothetical protein [Bartonella sp. A05]|uniref:hypothetical protein n=1 Tax=Bartonella sp. A05 TaxID=2967261 RepID=UPI0022A97CD0|nr:hypothetical protein [Bartonella sp. A05]MCZ2203611.1 hypothetical protein [Bartonella sp. A05]